MLKDRITGVMLDLAYRDMNMVRFSLSEMSILSITEESKSADWKDCFSASSKIANIGPVRAAQNTTL